MNTRSIVTRAALLAALWWVISGGAVDSWVVGTVSIVAALGVATRLHPVAVTTISATGLLAFLWFFLTASLRGGLQVAVRAVRPVPDLHPAMVDVPLRLPGEAERLFLASTLSLLPGTLSTGLEGRHLHLHLLDERLSPLDEVRKAEDHVARLFRKELA